MEHSVTLKVKDGTEYRLTTCSTRTGSSSWSACTTPRLVT